MVEQKPGAEMTEEEFESFLADYAKDKAGLEQELQRLVDRLEIRG